MHDDAAMNAEWLQKLDACRPDRADHQLPEMRDLAQALTADPQLQAWRRQVERLDRGIGQALADVSVPAGLAERIVARLQQQEEPAPQAAATTPAAPAPGPRRAESRRRWLAGSATAAVACAASLLVAWLLWPAVPAELNPEAVMELARAFDQDSPAAVGMMVAPPARFGLGDYVLPTAAVRWRALTGEFLGRDGVAYDLRGPHHERASLLVVNLQGPLGAPKLRILSRTPGQFVLTTAGRTSAVWTDGVRVFVLVVEGDQSTFRRFIREPGAMA